MANNNTKGAIITDFGDYDKGQFIQVQANGKIVVMGLSGDNLAVARYNSNGSLDTSFDKDGKLTAKAVMTVNAMQLLNDGKFVTAGASNNDFAVARYNNDGSLDITFDKDGIVTTDLDRENLADAIIVQTDNKLLVLGVGGYWDDFGAVRYNSNGSLDTSFNGTGIFTAAIGYITYDAATCFTVQPDGKMLLAGKGYDNFGIIRLNRDFTLDKSFGGDGIVVTDFGSADGIYTLNLSGTAIIAAGISGNSRFALAHYNGDGSLDANFGKNGIVTTDLTSDTLGGVVLKNVIALAAGKFLAVGTNGGYDTVLARFNANGSLDTSFSDDGVVSTDLGGWEEGNNVTVQKDGKILLVGTTDSDMALVRYNPDGSLDTSFDGTGSTPTNPDQPVDNGGDTQVDTGKASVSITPTDLQTNEQSDTAKFSVVLTSAPTRDVSISFTSSDTSEGKLDKALLTFTASNWATPQIITVTGQNDSQVDGNIAYTISGEISTIDVRYKSVKVDSITLTNQDTPVVGAETVNGTDGIDILHGTNAPSYMLGKAGDDDLSGGAGNDTIYGSYGSDVMFGEDDNDYLYGEQDADYVDGGKGNDSLDGGLGADTLIGGIGNDTYYLGYDAIDLIQDSGLTSDIDTVIMPYQLSKYTLPTGIENGTIAAGTQSSNLTGNKGNNALTGNDGSNKLNGDAGSDALNGGNGNDALTGGVGIDTLTGGEGKDSFYLLDTSKDTLRDFSPKYDTVYLENKVFDRLTKNGVLDTGSFKFGRATDTNDYVLYDSNTGALSYDADGSGAGAAVQIAVIGANLALTTADFMVM